VPIKIQTKHSAVKDKAPQPTDLIAGELAVNVHQDSPAIYLKDAAGAVRKVAGADAVGDKWTRTGTEISPKTAGDSVFTSGAVKVGGTTAAPTTVIQADGKVGIGTSTLAADLHVEGIGATSSFSGIVLSNKTTANSLQLIRTGPTFSYAGIGGNEGAVLSQNTLTLATDIGNPIRFCTAATERARITTTGDLLLGGTIPASPNITLKANGTGYFSNNLGIHTDAPAFRFHVKETTAIDVDIAADNPAGLARFGARGSGNAYVGSFTTGKDLELWSGGALKSALTSTGDLSLGGTIPASPNITLSADGNINAKGAVARVYADNTAAKAGGLVDGDIYRTATGQLMIVFT
jgi:hypothetical protein